MSLANCNDCGFPLPERAGVCPKCGTPIVAPHSVSGFSPPNAADRWVGQVAKTGIRADNTADKAGDIADRVWDAAGEVVDKVGGVAGDVAHKVGEVAGDVADKAGDVADTAADAGGWIYRLLKRIVFLALLPLWLVLLLFGCGPLS